jgi:hypothetical protein
MRTLLIWAYRLLMHAQRRIRTSKRITVIRGIIGLFASISYEVYSEALLCQAKYTAAIVKFRDILGEQVIVAV